MTASAPEAPRAASAATGFWTRPRFAALLLTVGIIHAVIGLALPLGGDEAYYWDASRHLDWSYFDMPPMVVWTIAPARLLLGDCALAVRLPAILASLIAGALMLPLTRRLGGGVREAAHAALLLQAMPIFFAGSAYAATDALMVPAYVAASLAAVALAQGARRAWWWFGAAAGLGFLAKFPVVIAVAALIPALARKQVRAELRTTTPYLAAALSAAFTAPVWIWGAQHGWDNVTFQLLGRHTLGAWSARHVTEFVLVAAMIVSPPLFAAILAAWRRAWRRMDAGWRETAAAGAAPFLLFLPVALFEQIGAHWVAPGMVVGAALLASLRFPARRALIASGAILGVILSSVALVVIAFPQTVVGLTRRDDGTMHPLAAKLVAGVSGDRELAAAVRTRLRPGELVASESYALVHLLAFHGGPALDTRLMYVGSAHGLASLYWYRPQELQGRDALFVTEKTRNESVWTEAVLGESFREVTEEVPVTITRAQVAVRTARFFRCRDLRKPDGTFTRLAPR